MVGAAVASPLLVVVGFVINFLLNPNQAAANEAQIRAGQSAAANAVRHDAEQVHYWLQGTANSSIPQLVIANRSNGPIRDITVFLPQPVHNHSLGTTMFLSRSLAFVGSKAGIEITADGKGYYYYTLPDIPPCSVEATRAFTVFRHPSAGQTALNGSVLEFTDPNGNAWELDQGDDKLIRLTGYKPPAGFSWSGSAKFQRAAGCS